MKPPEQHIGRGDVAHWHVDDQFERQLGNPARAATILARWEIFAAALESVLAQPEPIRVLDAGCGDGINLVGLRRIFDVAHRRVDIFAVDLNPLRVSRARVDGRAAGTIACASVHALPFQSGSFDVVLCNHVMEHLENPENAAHEIFRVLRPAGLAIVGVPNEGAALGQLRNHVLQRSILKTTDHVNFFTARDLRALLERASFVVTDIRTAGFFVPHLRVFGWLARFAVGRWTLNCAGRLWPSQSADLIAMARREA
jgi:SAM-dependent methyltransferase